MTSLLQSEAAREYRDEAKEFCALVDRVAQMPPGAWLTAVHSRLPRLYAAALALPEVEPDTDGAGERVVMTKDSETVRSALSQVLARWDLYSFVFDPYEQDAQPVGGTLAGDLSEIYDDVTLGLAAEQVAGDTRPGDVLWDWRFAFRSHWARHATTALAALHTALLAEFADHLPETFGRPS